MSVASKIETFWYSDSLLKWLLMPFSWLIQALVFLKYFLYQLKILKPQSSKVPVIVVGNITVGGTGKTPFISFLVQQFKQQNINVGIVSRGYKSHASSYPHIINSDDTVEMIGDEAFMQYARSQVPMAIGADRAAAVAKLCENFQLDIVISDDGLQHYSMSRKFEILMVDAKRLFGNHLMLPFGPLREPVSRINSTDYIILNGKSSTALNSIKTSTPISSMLLATESLIQISSGDLVDLSIIKGKKIAAVAAIGNPCRFFESLAQHCDLNSKNIFSDHHRFVESDFAPITSETIVMTEKDAVKCQSFAKDNWYYLKVKATLDNKDFEQLFELINSKLNLS